MGGQRQDPRLCPAPTPKADDDAGDEGEERCDHLLSIYMPSTVLSASTYRISSNPQRNNSVRAGATVTPVVKARNLGLGDRTYLAQDPVLR